MINIDRNFVTNLSTVLDVWHHWKGSTRTLVFKQSPYVDHGRPYESDFIDLIFRAASLGHVLFPIMTSSSVGASCLHKVRSSNNGFSFARLKPGKKIFFLCNGSSVLSLSYSKLGWGHLN